MRSDPVATHPEALPILDETVPVGVLPPPAHGPFPSPFPAAAGTAVAGVERTSPFGALVQTTKPGIVRLVTITAMVGFAMGAVQRSAAESLQWLSLIDDAVVCMLGTALAAAGSNSINQFMERDRDAIMRRTAKRPLPAGLISPRAVLAFGIALGVLGCGLLVAWGHLAAAAVAAACLIIYVAFYTPMKPVSTTATFVGAFPGALPPLIGWAAASATPGWVSLSNPAAWTLFALMFVWQIPHFLAIAWMYKDDYADGGYAVLPARDPTGQRTAATISVWTWLLLIATIAPALYMPQSLGGIYISIAVVSGLGYAYLAFRLVRRLERSAARTLFFGSIIHLPILMIAMVTEALIRVIAA